MTCAILSVRVAMKGRIVPPLRLKDVNASLQSSNAKSRLRAFPIAPVTSTDLSASTSSSRKSSTVVSPIVFACSKGKTVAEPSGEVGVKPSKRKRLDERKVSTSIAMKLITNLSLVINVAEALPLLYSLLSEHDRVVMLTHCRAKAGNTTLAWLIQVGDTFVDVRSF